MPDTASITTIKRFTYRDALEEWSNTYHFSGATPANDTAWKAAADNLIAREKLLLTSNTKLIRAYGYQPGTDHSIWQHDYLGPPDTAVAGTITYSASSAAPGDAAVWIRAWTGEYNSRGKKIYVRKYFHDVVMSATDPDEQESVQKAAYNTFATNCLITDLVVPGKWCGAQAEVLSLPAVGAYITTRTLKRRGKRPPTSP